MTKQITLVAKTFLHYRGRSYGLDMQFEADAKDADRFVESGQAALLTDEKKADPELADALTPKKQIT